MTSTDIIATAREAGLNDEVLVPWAFEIERFAAFVAAAERKRFAWTQEHWTEYERNIAAAERERIKTANAPEIERVNKELRRLHEVNQELLEALKQILVGAQSQGPHTGMSWFNVETIAKTTIAKAKEQP